MSAPAVKDSLTPDPVILEAIASGEICTVCGSIIDKQKPGTPRTCADSDFADVWQDPEFACPTLKRKSPWVAPFLRRKRLANLFGLLGRIANETKEALEDEGAKPNLESLVEEMENVFGWIKAKTSAPRKALGDAPTPERKEP